MELHGVQGINLQATLSASSAGGTECPRPHHPITCATDLRYEEDGSFGCEHTTVPPTDSRLRDVLQHSVAILLLEVAIQAFNEGNICSGLPARTTAL